MVAIKKLLFQIRISLLVLLGILYLPYHLHAQIKPHIYATKVNRNFKLRYYEHDRIRFRVDNQDYFTEGPIEGFTDSSFYVFQTEVMLSDITELDIRGLNFSVWSFRSSPSKLVIAGLALPLIDAVNNQGVSGSIWIISAGLVTAGAIMKLLEPKFFRPGGPNKMIIVR